VDAREAPAAVVAGRDLVGVQEIGRGKHERVGKAQRPKTSEKGGRALCDFGANRFDRDAFTQDRLPNVGNPACPCRVDEHLGVRRSRETAIVGDGLEHVRRGRRVESVPRAQVGDDDASADSPNQAAAARVLPSMTATFATVWEEDGVGVASATVHGFVLSELRFPAGYDQPPFEPEAPYVAVVLDGALVKSFPRRSHSLEGGTAMTIPAGATHAARFGPAGARVVLVASENGVARLDRLDRLAELRGRELIWLAWRLAAELRAVDAAAPLAAEGFALELVAATTRETYAADTRLPAWLVSAEELLRERVRESVTLGVLAQSVGVHPAHLARTFRAHFGVSVGEYGRRLRLAWAAGELARGNRPLAEIAVEAGFADQSHFTRVFKRHVGTTPARYREQTSRTGNGR
jgi:AraC family transcriptional regulator